MFDSNTVQALVTVGAESRGLYEAVSNETIMGPELFDRIQFHWKLLIRKLNELKDVVGTLPPTVEELLSSIAAIVNEAAIGPGYADVCMGLRNPELGRLGKALWKEAIRHHRGPAVTWPETIKDPASDRTVASEQPANAKEPELTTDPEALVSPPLPAAPAALGSEVGDIKDESTDGPLAIAEPGAAVAESLDSHRQAGTGERIGGHLTNVEWTRPMTKTKAASLLGYPGAKKAEWINQCVKDGTLQMRPKTRQSFQFNLDAFPEATHLRLRPTHSK